MAMPYLMVRGAAAAIEFYKKAFGAVETMRFEGPDGTIGHAEVLIEGAPIALSDEWAGGGVSSPSQIGGTTMGVSVHVKDVDAFTRRAEAAGATIVRPMADQFYGERSATLKDPFGHVWYFSTVTETLTAEEMMRRMPK
jgi:PhnB protein